MEWKPRIRNVSIYWIPFLLCVVMLYVTDVFQTQYFNLQLSKPTFNDVSFDEKAFIIHTPGCKIPYMDPFDQHIKKYLETPNIPNCNEGKPALFEANLTHIYLLKSSLSAYHVNDTTKLKCCYASFWRQEPSKEESDNKITLNSTCHFFNDSHIIREEFIKVTCTYGNKNIYTDTFAFVPLKPNTTDEANRFKQLNVLVVGLDAVSRLNLYRQMPKTLKYLKEQDAVELLGYNKVGDNTFPNLIPVLTGLSVEELEKGCWPRPEDHFDNCTFLWNLYKKEGYATAFGEDASWMGLFNYQRRGFLKQATDYAYNYFNRYSEDKIGNAHSVNVNDCEGARLIFKDFFDYIMKFVTTMDKNQLPYFGFFWEVALSHDYLNKPKLGDEHFYLFFKKLVEDKHLEHTALVFMSDHGIRWGDIRQTFQGRMEERLPFVYLLLPKTFQEMYPTAYMNLKLNTKRLTTPFDLHETLVDLLQPLDLLVEENLLNSNQSRRGISFFKKIIKERTCENAGIESHWCTCQQSVEINTNSSVVEQAADSAIRHMNNLLGGYAQCANLTLDKILNARLMTHGSQISGSNMISDYMLTLRALPSEAVFEATIRFSEKANFFEVIGTISRLNLYGDQSACITDFHLKLYCYCKSLLGQ